MKLIQLNYRTLAVIGWIAVVSGLQAFRWESVGGIRGLGILTGGRGWSDALGVSRDGSVVVGHSSPSSNPWESEAVFWTPAEGMQRLGDLPGGLVDSEAVAASADGRFLVGHGRSAISKEAVLWDRMAGIVPIRDILEDAGVGMSGWTITEANDISADGTVVVGNGINPEGNFEGWIAVLADEEPPVIVEGTAAPNTLWPANRRMIHIHLDAVVTDDSGAAEWKVAGIDCDESCPDSDMGFVDEHTVKLRATRFGKGDGRVYTVWLQASDAAGNLSEMFPVEVTVPHDRRNHPSRDHSRRENDRNIARNRKDEHRRNR